ncbi:MAG: hypothetical protein ACFCD0_28805 [Gemmataceae bacterium]
MKFQCGLLLTACVVFVTPHSLYAEGESRFVGVGQAVLPQNPDVLKAPKKKPGLILPKKFKAMNYVRLTKDKKGVPQSMQTAVVRFVPGKGQNKLVVDLVGVVHMADGHYYRQLNQIFNDYDVVLYELVAPKGVRPQRGRRSDNPLAMIQRAMTIFLGLESQVEAIDYNQKNFVHADLSPTEMMQAMKKRGDDMFTIGLSVLADVLRQQNLAVKKMQNNPRGNQPPLDPLKMLSDPKGPSQLKRMLAESLAESAGGEGLGQTLTRMLVDDRNAACMKVFQQQLVNGKKKIAIFYGAAHMPDFEKRLIQDYGMRRDRVNWLDAWDLTPREVTPLELLLKLQRLMDTN